MCLGTILLFFFKISNPFLLQDEVKEALEKVCKRMPKSVRPDCTKFVDKYADLVISMLAQELDPDEVCRELKLCKPTAVDVVKGK